MTPTIDHSSSALVDENEKNEVMENLEPLAAKPSSPRPKKKSRTEKGMLCYTTSSSRLFSLSYVRIFGSMYYLVFSNLYPFCLSHLII